MYVLLGSNGQITSQLTQILLAEGQRIRVVGRNRKVLAQVEEAGGEIAVGDPGDAAFLADSFADATAVYTMLPPCYQEPDMRAAQDRIGETIVVALRKTGVRRVVNLSSIGAELPQGTGPIEALHAQEQRLNTIETLDLLHLRPGYFMENLLAMVPEVAAAGVMSGMEAPDAVIPMVATCDIARTIARELMAPQHRGALLLHAPEHMSMREAARIVAAVVDMPALQYVQAAPEDAKRALQSYGLSADAADKLEALARWLSSGSLASASAAPVAVQATTFEAFARESFAPACMQWAAEQAA